MDLATNSLLMIKKIIVSSVNKNQNKVNRREIGHSMLNITNWIHTLFWPFLETSLYGSNGFKKPSTSNDKMNKRLKSNRIKCYK